MPELTPGIAKRYLASELRRLRLAAGMSQDRVAAQTKYSPSRLSTLETGVTVPKARDFETLLPLYGASERVADFIEILPIAKKRNWWIKFSAVPDWFGEYLGLEEGATTIDTWNGLFIHDLLQTREYATVQLHEAMPGALAKDVFHQVDLRMRRQEVWLARGADRARFRIILSETALQPRGNFDALMWNQYEKLLALASDTVELRVLPLKGGPPASPTSPFSIVSLDIPDHPGVLYTETLTGGHYSENPQEIKNANLIFDALWKQVLSREKSLEVIRTLRMKVSS